MTTCQCHPQQQHYILLLRLKGSLPFLQFSERQIQKPCGVLVSCYLMILFCIGKTNYIFQNLCWPNNFPIDSYLMKNKQKNNLTNAYSKWKEKTHCTHGLKKFCRFFWKKKLGSLGGGTTVAGKGMAIKIMQYCLEFFWDLPIASSNTMWWLEFTFVFKLVINGPLGTQAEHTWHTSDHRWIFRHWITSSNFYVSPGK